MGPFPYEEHVFIGYMMTARNPASFSWPMLDIASVNFRGLSARTKRGALVYDLSLHEVDVCSLQETKISLGIDERRNGYRILSLPSKC